MPRYDFDTILDRRHTASSKWDKYPEDVLPLWVADTDFKAPQPVVEALTRRVAHGAFGYTWEHGSFERATMGWVKRRYGWDIDTAWVSFSPSVATSVGLAARALTKPGDNVVYQSPAYPPLFTAAKNNGRTPLGSPLHWENNTWSIDFDDLEEKLADPRSTLFLLCNPHNPTGRCFTEAELTRIGELCLNYGVAVLSDEIHADFVYTGRHISFAALCPRLAAISAVCVSPSKTFNLADMRTSAIITPGETVREAVKKELAAARLGRSSLGILAYDTAYGGECDGYADAVHAYLGVNLDRAVAFINASVPGVAAYRPEATFLLWLDCRELGRRLGLTQSELEDFFVTRAKVALNSGTEFGPEGAGFMRMNLASPASVIDEALTRIARAARVSSF